MKIKKIFCIVAIAAITVLSSLSLSALAANEGLPIRIYYDSNIFRTYISGEYTPSYPATGAYDTTYGKHISQVFVQAYENAWPNTECQKGTMPTSITSNQRVYTYYLCEYFTNQSRAISTSNFTNSAECTFYGVGQLLQGYSTRYKVFCYDF